MGDEGRSIRLNKYLAGQGLCSRREADEWIQKGYIHVNGKQVKEMGLKVDPEKDQVEVRQGPDQQKKHYYLLNKPKGYLSTVVENEGKSLLRLLPRNRNLFPVGRLDKNSEGLIIVTNDRTLTKKIIGENEIVKKEYLVRLKHYLTPTAQEKIENGLILFGKQLKPCRIKRLAESDYTITLTEGKNRQVRRVFQKVGNEVLLLRRIRIGNIYLDNIPEGSYKEVSEKFILDHLY